MLLRLSRASFCFAALAGSWAVAAPGDHRSTYAVLAFVAAGAGWVLRHSDRWVSRRRPDTPALAPGAVALGEATLAEAAARIARCGQESASLHDALHSVARVLRSELGFVEFRVFEVRSADADHLRLAELIEARPEFRPVDRPFRRDTSARSRAAFDRVTAAEVGGGVTVLPVCVDERVVALLELARFEIAVEPSALSGVLETARRTLDAAARSFGDTGPGPSILPVSTVRTGASTAEAWNSGLSPIWCKDQHGTKRIRAHVLVVEDNIVQSERTARMLCRMGAQVSVASGRLAGVDALRKTQFDMVLVDTEAPGMNVPGALLDMVAVQGPDSPASRGRKPFVALAPRGLPTDENRIRELGFDDFLFKPFGRNELHAMLSKQLPHAQPGSGDLPADKSADAVGQESVLDAAALARLIELDPTGANHLLERVLKAFQTSVARLSPQLEAARRNGDRAAIRLVAHTLKSSSASIGALKLSQICAQIETAIRTENGADLSPDLDAMNAALAITMNAISQRLGATS